MNNKLTRGKGQLALCRNGTMVTLELPRGLSTKSAPVSDLLSVHAIDQSGSKCKGRTRALRQTKPRNLQNYN